MPDNGVWSFIVRRPVLGFLGCKVAKASELALLQTVIPSVEHDSTC